MNPLGYHVNAWTPKAKGTVRAAPGAVLKVLNTAVGREEIAAYRQARPDGLTIFRWVENGGSLDDVPGRVRATLNAMKDIADMVDVVETPWNECHQSSDELDAYADATVQAVTLIEEAGYAAAFGGFSVGQPEKIDDLARFVAGVLSRLPKGRRRWLNLHEYSAPTMQDAVGERCLRYRALLDALEPSGLVGTFDLEIGEAGIDGGVLAPQRKGYRSYGGATAYAQQLRWYGGNVAADQVRYGIDIRVVVYCCGQYGDWSDYDVAGESEIESVMREDFTMGELADLKAKVETLAQQNAILTEAWKAFRQGKFTGADGIDGLIVAMQGGQPLGFEPSYPPKA